MYQNYITHKNYVKKKNNNDENERVLYHGTTEANVNNICQRGFNRSYCGVNGNIFLREYFCSMWFQVSHL